ncbi:MAG: 16S rRNA (guanine(527)-N(7))-methyltransferase RsmG [Candidatus Electrothrix aestuarii]|uniref:Ribosomal RNA small subunit methyltransferase G n=1 Tax=Candidatus Electrothrix aestuarii TaxID=3062594 RepID=A0AAU8LSD9_9BACT|nr:16S rRNA (guanine(527)-N(7))-methyltransferase RsmG [Candidatus Electrothrix aestuarii]
MCDKKQFLSGLNTLGLSLPQEQLDGLLLYCQELQKWSQRINLIARNTSARDIVEKHFLDSLTLLPIIQQYSAENGQDKNARSTLMDVGTGAGFPGLVLAAALPELTVTLVEPRQKRVSFLRHIVRTLGLANVQIMDQRIEQDQIWDGPEYSFVTSRAVAAKETFLPMIEGVASRNTVVIMMGATGEAPKANQDGQGEQGAPGWISLGEHKFSLPFSGDPRVLTLLQKAS